MSRNIAFGSWVIVNGGLYVHVRYAEGAVLTNYSIQLINRFIETLGAFLGMIYSTTMAYHPRSDGHREQCIMEIITIPQANVVQHWQEQDISVHSLTYAYKASAHHPMNLMLCNRTYCRITLIQETLEVTLVVSAYAAATTSLAALQAIMSQGLAPTWKYSNNRVKALKQRKQNDHDRRTLHAYHLLH